MSKKIAISEFKAHCLQIIDKLQINHESIVITKRDKPVATIMSFDAPVKSSMFGLLKDKAKIKRDIIKPISEKWSCEE